MTVVGERGFVCSHVRGADWLVVKCDGTKTGRSDGILKVRQRAQDRISDETESLRGDQRSELSGGAVEPGLDYIGSAGDRRYWETERKKYSLVVSEAVEAECERGDPKVVERRRVLLEEVSLFPVDERILELARLLVVPGAIPEKAGPDAVHIAAAAVEECEFLLTWNFRHIANVRIRREAERILANHGYTKTTICTPEELV